MTAPEMVAALEATGDYRVLSRLQCEPGLRRDLIVERREIDGAPLYQGLIVDCETTGLEASDTIIELAMLPFLFVAEGDVVEVDEVVAWLQEPPRPLTPEITRLTGLTNAELTGQAVDRDAAKALYQHARLVIAHNAQFDRPFIERLLGKSDKAWACSREEVPWREWGYTSTALEFLLAVHGRRFTTGHRAGADCEAVLAILETPGPDGVKPLAALVDSARRGVHRIWAIGAPYERKDLLKGRGYRWNDGSNGQPKAWYRDVAECEPELEWLAAASPCNHKVERITARTRYAAS